MAINLLILGSLQYKNEKYEASLKEELTLPSLHNSQFQPDPEPTLKTGVKVMTVGILELLNE